jgi:N utilization substance protein A
MTAPTMLEALGLEPDGPEFTPFLVTATCVSANADSAVMSFTHHATPVTGVLPVTDQVPGSTWTPGATAVVLVCEPPSAGARPRLSQVRPELVVRTLAAVSPEVRSGQVRVMGVARRPGLRTKVAVAATVEGVDPVAACVGRQHNRVDQVRAVLGGEQVDVVAWHPDQVTYLRNALQPAGVGEVVIDPETRSATAAAPAHQMSAAVGGGGLNSALAGQLVGLLVRIVPA